MFPFPVGVIVPSCVSSGLAKVCIKPCRRFFEKLKVCFLTVVGVAGGDDGPVGWAKLKLGVVGLIMAASIEVDTRLCVLYVARSRRQRPWQISSPSGRGKRLRGIAVHDK